MTEVPPDRGSDPRRKPLPGLTADDESRIKGEAIAGHIWDSMETMLGGEGSIRASYVTEAWSKAHKDWQGSQFDDSEEFPTVKVPGSDSFEGRYTVGGPYLEIHPRGKRQAIDALHMQDEDRNPKGVKRRMTDWLAEQENDR